VRLEGGNNTHKTSASSVSSKPGAPETKHGQDGGKNCLHLSEMTWWTTEDELRSLLSAGPKPVRIRFLEHPTNGKSRGVAIIQFESNDAAQAAYEIIFGKYVFLKEDA